MTCPNELDDPRVNPARRTSVAKSSVSSLRIADATASSTARMASSRARSRGAPASLSRSARNSRVQAAAGDRGPETCEPFDEAGSRLRSDTSPLESAKVDALAEHGRAVIDVTAPQDPALQQPGRRRGLDPPEWPRWISRCRAAVAGTGRSSGTRR